jgi:hypothetical protein
MASASGRSFQAPSSGTKRLNPTTPSARAINCGGRPHFGQAMRCAAAADVNRKQQLGQPT